MWALKREGGTPLVELNTLKKPVFLMNGIFEVHQDGTIYRHSKKVDNYANR